MRLGEFEAVGVDMKNWRAALFLHCDKIHKVMAVVDRKSGKVLLLLKINVVSTLLAMKI